MSFSSTFMMNVWSSVRKKKHCVIQFVDVSCNQLKYRQNWSGLSTPPRITQSPIAPKLPYWNFSLLNLTWLRNRCYWDVSITKRSPHQAPATYYPTDPMFVASVESLHLPVTGGEDNAFTKDPKTGQGIPPKLHIREQTKDSKIFPGPFSIECKILSYPSWTLVKDHYSRLINCLLVYRSLMISICN